MVQCAVLYPPGGAFNKLRRRQVFLGNLLKDILQDYCELPRFKEKQSFVRARVLDQLKANGYVLMIFDGDHPERGRLVQPTEYEACTKVIQKLRSMKKVILACPPSHKQVERKEKRQCAVLYPRGAAFDELRRSQVFLGNLLKDILQDYYELPPCCYVKQSFIKQRVFDQLEANGYVLMIFDGEHPDRGSLVQPKGYEAYEKVMQKLRSMKKVILAGTPSDKQVARKEKRLEKEVCQQLLSMKKMRLAGPPREQATRTEERFRNIVQVGGTSNTAFASIQNLFRPTVPAAVNAFNRIGLMLPPFFPSGQDLFFPTVPAAFDASRFDSMLPTGFASGLNLFWPMAPSAFNAFNRIDWMLPHGFVSGQNIFQRGLADNNKPAPTFAVPTKPHPIPIMPRPSKRVQNHHSTYRYNHHRQGQRRSSQPPQIPLL